MKLSKILKNGRIRCDLTLDEVADGTGMSKSYVWDLENGNKENISLMNAVRLSVCLQIPITVIASSVLEQNQ